MSGDFVQQEDRRASAPTRHEISVGENQAQQECLLFAGGRLARRHPLGAVKHNQVLPMGTLGGSAGSSVTRPVAPKRRSQVARIPTLKRDCGPRKFVIRSNVELFT